MSNKIRLILGDNCEITGKPGDNLNALAVAPPGGGKTYSFMTPNILLSDGCSFFVDDKKGVLYNRCKDTLEQQGYKVYYMDLVKGCGNIHYNPFSSIVSNDDVRKIVYYLLPDTYQSNDPFWINSARNLAELLIQIGRVYYNSFNMKSFLNLLYRTSTGLDQFNRPQNEYVVQLVNSDMKKADQVQEYFNRFLKMRTIAHDTWTCIREMCISICSNYNLEKLFSVTDETTFDFRLMGKEKIALFITSSDTDATLAPFVQVMYYDICNKLITMADTECLDNNNMLFQHVRFLLDDFASGTRMDNFENVIANARSRNISFLLGIQSLSQLYALYHDMSETILDCIRYKVYFPSNNLKTLEYMSTIMNVPLSDVQTMGDNDICIERPGKIPSFHKRYCIDTSLINIPCKQLI